MEKLESSHIANRNMNGSTIMGNILAISQKLNIELSSDSAKPFHGVYPKDLEASTYIRAVTFLLMEALFTTVKM